MGATGQPPRRSCVARSHRVPRASPVGHARAGKRLGSLENKGDGCTKPPPTELGWHQTAASPCPVPWMTPIPRDATVTFQVDQQGRRDTTPPRFAPHPVPIKPLTPGCFLTQLQTTKLPERSKVEPLPESRAGLSIPEHPSPNLGTDLRDGPHIQLHPKLNLDRGSSRSTGRSPPVQPSSLPATLTFL